MSSGPRGRVAALPPSSRGSNFLPATGRRRRCGQTPAEGDRSAVAGRLVEHAVRRHGLGKGGGVRGLRYLEGVETGAMEQQELIAQHLSGRAQLAAKMVALT